MNIFSQIKILPEMLMNSCSSVFLASDTVITSSLSADNIVTRIIQVFLQLFYFACKWVMYIVDVIYFYVMQLAGVSIDTSILDSAQSDPTFNLLISNKELVTTIIKNFIAIAIVLIIVTAVIAIIRQQTMALKEKKAKKGPAEAVLKSMFKSVLLIILTPMIAIVGIVASSVILQSLYNATNLSETKSLSARVFNVSASAASKYRMYAENGVRIPIKYKFSAIDDDNKNEVERANNAINYAVQMIGNEKFPALQYFDLNANFTDSEFQDPVLKDKVITRSAYSSGTEEWRNNTYYAYFDSSDNYSPNAKNEHIGDKFKIMHTHTNEYYAMADVVSYALDTMEEFYFITIQELLESVLAATPTNNALQQSRIKKLIEDYSIRVFDTSQNLIGMDYTGTSVTNAEAIVDALKYGHYAYITYDTTYRSGTYTYTHVKDAIDEMEGAKFIMAYKVLGNREFVKNINGDYYDDNPSDAIPPKKVEKYFYKESEKSKYKLVDLYYYYNMDLDDYAKSPTYPVPGGGPCYYKLGDQYYEITSDRVDKFYFKDESGDYQSLTLGEDNFYADTQFFYYQPLVEGVAVGNSSVFTSEYIEPARIITARGLFDETSYPTAMRRTSSGDLMFYRDDLELIANGSVSDFGTMDQVEVEDKEAQEEETAKEKNVFQKIGGAVKSAWNSTKKFVTKVFNPKKVVPDLKINQSAMSTTYTNRTHSIHVLKEGKLHISYFFSDKFSSGLSAKLYNLNLNHLFEPMNINYVTLVAGSVVLLKIMVTAVFGLIQRSLNLLILILIYPVACATIPLDDASGTGKTGAYAKWSQKYTNQLFSTYGLILGINFVFLIIPVIDGLTFFTPEDFQSNKALTRIAYALYNPLMILPFNIPAFVQPNYVVICNFLNWILRIIFQIAAFSLITAAGGKGGGDTYYSVIQTVVGVGPGTLEDSPLDAVKKVLTTATTVVTMIAAPGRALKKAGEQALKSAEGIKDFVPGSAIVNEGVDVYKRVSNQHSQEASRKALLEALKNKESKESVDAKLKDYKSTHNVK